MMVCQILVLNCCLIISSINYYRIIFSDLLYRHALFQFTQNWISDTYQCILPASLFKELFECNILD